MGFGSSRLAPVLMMVGQSAASAASFAIDDNVPVQQVSHPKLKAQMLSDGRMPEWNPSSSGNLVVDNTGTSGFLSFITPTNSLEEIPPFRTKPYFQR